MPVTVKISLPSGTIKKYIMLTVVTVLTSESHCEETKLTYAVLTL